MKLLCQLVLGAAIGLVALGGFAWPLGYGQYSPWPFSHAWHMYGYSSAQHSQLALKAHLENGETLDAPMQRWFAYEAAPASLRFNEIARDVTSLRALATYVCRQFNVDAPAGARATGVTVIDLSWPMETGQRRVPTEVTSVREWKYLDNYPCTSGPP